MQALDRLLGRVLTVMAALAGVIMVATMAGIVFQATARTLGYSGSSHVFTFTEYGLLFMTLLAAPLLVRLKGHVYIEIVTAAVPDPVRIVLSRLVAVISMLTCLVLAWYAGEVTHLNFIRDQYDMRSLDMPRYLLIGPMVICFALMAIEFGRFVFGREVMHTGRAGVHE